jgi:hypothetical protein
MVVTVGGTASNGVNFTVDPPVLLHPTTSGCSAVPALKPVLTMAPINKERTFPRGPHPWRSPD